MTIISTVVMWVLVFVGVFATLWRFWKKSKRLRIESRVCVIWSSG